MSYRLPWFVRLASEPTNAVECCRTRCGANRYGSTLLLAQAEKLGAVGGIRTHKALSEPSDSKSDAFAYSATTAWCACKAPSLAPKLRLGALLSPIEKASTVRVLGHGTMDALALHSRLSLATFSELGVAGGPSLDIQFLRR